jgi:hypothetical protein
MKHWDNMTPEERTKHAQWAIGYDARIASKPRDKARSEEWISGWDCANRMLEPPTSHLS